MPSYSARQNNDTVSCPQCGGTGRIVATSSTGAQIEAPCGFCKETGTVTRKQERSYYDNKTPRAKTVSEEEIIRMEESRRKNSGGDASGGVKCPACRGLGTAMNPKNGLIETCKLCKNSGIVSQETASLWRQPR